MTRWRPPSAALRYTWHRVLCPLVGHGTVVRLWIAERPGACSGLFGRFGCCLGRLCCGAVVGNGTGIGIGIWHRG